MRSYAALLDELFCSDSGLRMIRLRTILFQEVSVAHNLWRVTASLVIVTSQDAVPKGGGEAKEQDGQQPFEW